MTTTPPAKLRASGLAILRDQRLRVLYAETAQDAHRPHAAILAVQSSRGTGTYAIDLYTGGDGSQTLTCTCRHNTEPACAHRYAAALILGVTPPSALTAPIGATA